MKIPTHLSAAKMYDADNNMQMVGVASVTLPNLQPKKVTLEGMGLMGSIDNPVAGSYDPLQLSVSCRGLTKDTFNALNGVKNFEFRGSQNVYDTSLKQNTAQQIRVIVSGPAAAFDLGEAEIPGTMSAKIDIEVYNLKILVNKESVFELDKWNDVNTVGGEDIISDIIDNIS